MMTFDTMLQFFPRDLRELIKASDTSDVMVNPDGSMFVDRGGQLVYEGRLENMAQLLVGVQNIARVLGQDLEEERPILDSRLPDGSRVAAVLNGEKSLALTIRKFNRWYSLEELVQSGTMPARVAEFLAKTMEDGHQNVLVSGGTGSGKSTLVKALLDKTPATDRLIVIEKPRELSVSHTNVVHFEAADPAPGKQATRTIAQLLVASLRHRPDRIVIGEVREPDTAYQLLQAMNTGHSGTLSTIHADNAVDALARLGDLVLAAHANLNQAFVRDQVARTIHCVVHVARFRNGHRRVTEVYSVQRGSELKEIYGLEGKE